MPKCHPDLARYQYLNQWIIDVVVGLYDNKGQKEKADSIDMKRPFYQILDKGVSQQHVTF